jgi:hypothetical protein
MELEERIITQEVLQKEEKLQRKWHQACREEEQTMGHFSSYTNPIRLLPSYAEMPSYTSLFQISHCKKEMLASLHKF